MAEIQRIERVEKIDKDGDIFLVLQNGEKILFEQEHLNNST